MPDILENRPPTHILVVEDDPTQRMLLQEELQGARPGEFVTTYAERLQEAQAHLTKDEFDVVLLDLGLPDSQGVETLVRLRQHKPEVPVLVLTGLDNENLGEWSVQLGAQDYLVKGHFPIALLRRCLRYAIERHYTALQLRHSEARLSGLVRAARDAIITVDSAHRIKLFNSAAERAFGWQAKDMLGQTLARLIPERFRSARTGLWKLFGQIDLSGSDGDELALIYGLRADGTEFPMEASLAKVQVAGDQFVTLILRDITERQSAEASLHLRAKALEAAANGILTTLKRQMPPERKEAQEEGDKTFAELQQLAADIRRLSHELHHANECQAAAAG